MFASLISRVLPDVVRKPVRKLYYRLITKRSLDVLKFRPRRLFIGKDVVVAGIFRSGTGLGRAAELVALSLEELGSVVTRVDLTSSLNMPLRHGKEMLVPSDCQSLNPTDVIFVLNPDNYSILRAFDQGWLLKRCIVGHWIWELENIPASWSATANSFDEIWAPTDFVLQSIRVGLPNFSGAFRMVPYAVWKDPWPSRTLEQRVAARRGLDIKQGTFALGYAFSAGSNYQRKNPEALVQAFKNAFVSQADQVVLILRCSDLEHLPEERSRLLSCIDGDRRIRLFETRNELSLENFYAAIDLMVSPSRAEGYGLTLVEAVQAGVPVITTDWRLASDIRSLPAVQTVRSTLVAVKETQGHYSGVLEARWAEPLQDELVVAIRGARSKALSRGA